MLSRQYTKLAATAGNKVFQPRFRTQVRIHWSQLSCVLRDFLLMHRYGRENETAKRVCGVVVVEQGNEIRGTDRGTKRQGLFLRVPPLITVVFICQSM